MRSPSNILSEVDHLDDCICINYFATLAFSAQSTIVITCTMTMYSKDILQYQSFVFFLVV